MGTGIGINCKICQEQLNQDDGFDIRKQLCDNCLRLIPKVLNYLATEKEIKE